MALVSVVKTSGVPGTFAEGAEGIVGGYYAQLLDVETAKLSTIAAFSSSVLTPFGGKSWQARYTGAPDATNGSISNLYGTGLRFSANGNNSLWGGSPAASRLELDLRELAPLLGDLTDGPLRVRVWFATPVPMVSQYQFFHVGVGRNPTSTGLYLLGGVGFNLGDGGTTTQGQIQHAGASPNYYLNPALLGTNDVIDVRFVQPFAMSFRFGKYNAGALDPWPRVLRPQGTIASQPTNGNLTIDTWVQARDAALGAGPGNNGLSIMMGTSTGAAGVPFNNFTVKRISIDQWRSGA